MTTHDVSNKNLSYFSYFSPMARWSDDNGRTPPSGDGGGGGGDSPLNNGRPQMTTRARAAGHYHFISSPSVPLVIGTCPFDLFRCPERGDAPNEEMPCLVLDKGEQQEKKRRGWESYCVNGEDFVRMLPGGKSLGLPGITGDII